MHKARTWCLKGWQLDTFKTSINQNNFQWHDSVIITVNIKYTDGPGSSHKHLCMHGEYCIKWLYWTVTPVIARTFAYIILTTGYRLQSTDYRLQTTDYRLQTTGYRLQTTDYRLQTTDYRLQSDTVTIWLYKDAQGQNLILEKVDNYRPLHCNHMTLQGCTRPELDTWKGWQLSPVTL